MSSGLPPSSRGSGVSARLRDVPCARDGPSPAGGGSSGLARAAGKAGAAPATATVRAVRAVVRSARPAARACVCASRLHGRRAPPPPPPSGRRSRRPAPLSGL